MQQRAVWSLAGASWSKPSHPGMTNPTLAAVRRPFAAVANWAEHLYRCPKINFSTKEVELWMEKLPVLRLILVREGRRFCKTKSCIHEGTGFPFDQRGTCAARRKMEVYGFTAGREQHFHQNWAFCSSICRCAGVYVEDERCCTSGTGQLGLNNTKMWLLWLGRCWASWAGPRRCSKVLPNGPGSPLCHPWGQPVGCLLLQPQMSTK